VFAPQNVSYFWEDIICKYWPWARNKEHLFPGSMDMTPCLSVMHGKAHSWPCGVCNFLHTCAMYKNQIFQIIWGGRWQDGAAGGSGEDMEQLFSNLSRWAFSTKMLSAAGMYTIIFSWYMSVILPPTQSAKGVLYPFQLLVLRNL